MLTLRFVCPNGPCGTTFWLNPNTLTRMPPTQYPLSGKAAPPPNSRDAFPSLQQGADPLGWAQGDPREPQGAQGYLRAPSAPLGGMGPRGSLGLYRSHSEWNPVSIGWLLRNDSEIKTVAGKPSERKGFKVLPKPLEDQGGLGSEIMPRWCMGSIGREITKQFVPKLTIW